MAKGIDWVPWPYPAATAGVTFHLVRGRVHALELRVFADVSYIGYLRFFDYYDYTGWYGTKASIVWSF